MSQAAGDAALPDWVLALRSRSCEQLIRICRRQSPRWPEEDLAPWAESKLQLSPNVAGTFAGPREDLSEAFSSIRCPVLFLKADASEAVRREHRVAVSPLRDATLVHITGAGHNVRRDNRAETLVVLRRFLARL